MLKFDTRTDKCTKSSLMYLQVPVQFLPASLLITGQSSNPSFESPSANPVSSADKFVDGDGDCGYVILVVDGMSYEGGIVNALQNKAYPAVVMNINKH